MITVKRLKEILERLPENALAYVYEGEVVGIIFVSAEDKAIRYIPTRDKGSDDFEFIRATAT